MIRSRVSKSLKTESRLKTALYYAIELLVDVLIIYVFVKAFSIAFSFGYDIFHDSAKDPADRSYVMVDIEPYSSTSKISGTLYDAGVIESKYVMMLRIKVGGYSDKIKAGNYGLSPSMTYEQIMNVITGNADANVNDASGTGGTGYEDTASGTDAIDPNKIQDNSDVGAGEGSNEGGEGVETPEGFEDSGEDGGEGEGSGEGE